MAKVLKKVSAVASKSSPSTVAPKRSSAPQAAKRIPAPVAPKRTPAAVAPKRSPAAAEPKRSSATSGAKRVKFEFEAEPGSEVCIAGTFNNWDAKKNKLQEKGGQYSAMLMLPKGRYEYKFVVNGVWCVDPKCPEWAPNNFGSLNSVITIE